MKTQEKIQTLEKNFVFLCGVDYFDLSALVLDVKEELGLDDSSKVRAITMEIVSDLLGSDLVRPGFPTRNGGFDAWRLSAKEAIARIECEWDELGREVSLGDIAWFEATEKGEEYVADYSPKDSGLAVEEAE